MIQNTKFYSKKIGTLAKGCQQCVQGRKSVLFITGICPANCYFCPISDKKKNKDVICINEWPTGNIKDIIKEIKLCDSFGVGITGGDPLARLWRTTFCIRKLKKHFGKKFHTHLYTPLILVDKNKLKKLYKAGLDEIRFHPDLDNQRLWHKIPLAKEFNWKIGIEIPVIPGKYKQTTKLINLIKDKVNFLNLNELEIADTKANKLIKLGFGTKDTLSYGVKGSEELALKLLKYCSKNTKLNVHYCTAKLKDKIQLSRRIKRRSKNIAKPYDIMNQDGTLFRGAIYCKNPKQTLKKLKKRFKIPSNLIEIDKNKDRILTASWIVDELKDELKKLKLKPALVEEYPTWDQFEVSAEFL